MLFFQSYSESYLGGHYFYMSKIFCERHFCPGHPPLYGACSCTPGMRNEVSDMFKKLSVSPYVGPRVLTKLFQFYYLSLSGSSPWLLSYPALYSIKVAFSYILRKFWHLPRCSHTYIVHFVANLNSLYNVMSLCSRRHLFSSN